MDTADFNHHDFENRYAGDKGVLAQFYVKPVKNEQETAKQGRAIFENKEYVRIIAAGNQNNIVERPVSDLDKARFSRQYEMFKAGIEDQMIGTPLSEVGWLNPAQQEELAYHKIRTLEQLSVVSDDVCGRIPGLYELKMRAGQVLKAAEDRAPITELQEELRKKDEQIAELTASIKDLTKKMTELSSKK